MTAYQIINGLQEQWQILEKLGEGDAGEIFRVEALRSRKVAVLKRPLQGSMPAQSARQAAQISAEARILKSLAALHLPNPRVNLSIPRLLDESLPGNELTERAFIILEQANGLSLAALARLARFGPEPPSGNGAAGSGAAGSGAALLSAPRPLGPFEQAAAASRRLPDLLLLRAAVGLWALLDAAHAHPTTWIDSASYGILWNDLKLEHLFWDPSEARFWVIDWGNAQFLNENGESADGLFTAAADYEQLFEELGRFLAENAPALHARLGWPAAYPGADAADELHELRQGLLEALDEAQSALAEQRGREAYLCAMTHPDAAVLDELAQVQAEILSYGELPNQPAAAELRSRWALGLLQQGDLAAFWEAARELSHLPGESGAKWKALARAAAEIQPESDPASLWRAALEAGAAGSWAEALWEFCRLSQNDPDPARWNRLSGELRRMVPEVNSGAPSPLVAVSRLVQLLDDEYRRLAALQPAVAGAGPTGDPSNGPPGPDSAAAPLGRVAALLARLKNEVVKKWTLAEPTPPAADVSYRALTGLLDDLRASLAELNVDLGPRLAPVERALTQALAQAAIFDDAWQGRGFQTARHSLRNLLVWDPDRRRVLQADRAVASAQAWLDELAEGPQKGENLVDFAIRSEFQGRDLRGRVGPARWLEGALALLADLRGGRRPSELVEENPDLMIEYPWLRRFKRRPTAAVAPNPVGGLAGAPGQPLKTAPLGEGGELVLAEALDNWVGEARGSSARVFLGYLSSRRGELRQAAVKLMRPDKIDYALPLFWEEVQVLTAVQDVPGVVKWYECGFIRLEEGQELPHETSAASARPLSGSVVRIDPDEAGLFLAELEPRAAAGWLPYLALEKKNHRDNLLALCDASYTRGNFLPLEQALAAAVQIAEILQSAHERRVVYRDHKILHYYWNAAGRRVTAIDWNVARLHPDGLPEGEVELDLVQFGARALHHLFTGRPAPGALPVGPNQPQEIESAPHTYAPSWTYDDQQRLPPQVRQILTAVLAGAYESAERLREDLLAQSPA